MDDGYEVAISSLRKTEAGDIVLRPDEKGQVEYAKRTNGMFGVVLLLGIVAPVLLFVRKE